MDAHNNDDKDLKIIRNAENRGIVFASNAAILAASAPWITFLDHDDTLMPYTLERIHRAISSNPECDFLYTDEVVADGRLRPIEIFLKPDFEPVFCGVNFLNHLTVYRRDRVRELGGLREEFEGSQDYDLALRYTKGLESRKMIHVIYPAYIWRRDGHSFSARHMERATASAKKALERAYNLEMTDIKEADGALHRIDFPVQGWPLVSVVIPS